MSEFETGRDGADDPSAQQGTAGQEAADEVPAEWALPGQEAPGQAAPAPGWLESLGGSGPGGAGGGQASPSASREPAADNQAPSSGGDEEAAGSAGSASAPSEPHAEGTGSAGLSAFSAPTVPVPRLESEPASASPAEPSRPVAADPTVPLPRPTGSGFGGGTPAPLNPFAYPQAVQPPSPPSGLYSSAPQLSAGPQAAQAQPWGDSFAGRQHFAEQSGYGVPAPPFGTAPGSPGYLVTPPRRRAPVIAAVAILALAAGFGAGFATGHSTRPSAQPSGVRSSAAGPSASPSGQGSPGADTSPAPITGATLHGPLAAALMPVPAGGSRQSPGSGAADGTLSLDQFVNLDFNGSSSEKTDLQNRGFVSAATLWFNQFDGSATVYLIEFQTAAGAQSQAYATAGGFFENHTVGSVTELSAPGLADGVEFEDSVLDKFDNTATAFYGYLGNVTVFIHFYNSGSLDQAKALQILSAQVQALTAAEK